MHVLWEVCEVQFDDFQHIVTSELRKVEKLRKSGLVHLT